MRKCKNQKYRMQELRRQSLELSALGILASMICPGAILAINGIVTPPQYMANEGTLHTGKAQLRHGRSAKARCTEKEKVIVFLLKAGILRQAAQMAQLLHQTFWSLTDKTWAARKAAIFVKLTEGSKTGTPIFQMLQD